MNLPEFFAELRKRNLLLYWFGWFNVLLLVVAIILQFTDDTIVSGLNAWIKPSKFAISIAVYAWTFAWMLWYLNDHRKIRFISIMVVICMFAENFFIFMQAFRGVGSHFNVKAQFDDIVFAIMGVFILINTFVVLHTVVLFFRRPIALEPTMLLAWRWGLVMFLLGAVSGGTMSTLLRHTIGGPDAGPSLPYINWSTVAGDVRSAHFFTLHALQIIPLGAYFFTNRNYASARSLTIVFGCVYTFFCLWLHWLALSGLPLIRL